jgi:putative hydrolase of the HAD superfamily
MRELPTAIFFDLDDTIIDDSANVEDGWRTAIGDAIRELRGLDAETLLRTVFEVRDWYWSDAERHRRGRADLRAASSWIVDESLSRLGFKQPDLARQIAHHYRDLRDQGRSLLPGAVETLERVRALGIKTALLTNGDAIGQRTKLTQFDLARHFDYVCIEGEFGCGKPDERVYLGALGALVCRPQRTWMVGDNLEWDVAAPMRLGLTGIWLDRFKAGLPKTAPTQPDRTILSLSELL